MSFEPRTEPMQTRCGTVVIIDDTNADEPDEEFAVRITAAAPVGDTTENNETCITIIDNDRKFAEHLCYSSNSTTHTPTL